ncbi:MAG: CoA transferase [Halioglobus sp.]|nr:CoA transferase [Halioglobus sp.]
MAALLYRCAEVLEQSGLALDPRFCSNVARCANRGDLDAVIERVFTGLAREELSRRLQAAKIAFGAVNSVSDLVEHAQLRRQSVDTPSGAVELVAPPARSSGPARRWRGVPAIGQHGSDIRREFSAGGNARRDREAPVGGE